MLRTWLFGSLAMAIAAAPMSAQTAGSTPRPVGVEVVGGLTVATLSLPLIPPELGDLGFEFSVGNRLGFVGGVLIGAPVGDGIDFETGALISLKGATTKATIPEFGTASGDIRLTYVDVPLAGRFRVAQMSRGPISVVAGATMSFKLDAEQSATFMGQTISQTIDEGVSAFDVGLTLGGRVEIGHVIVDGRYTFGMLNVASESGPEGESLKHRVLSIMAGWRF
jgi:hypothetical protein